MEGWKDVSRVAQKSVAAWLGLCFSGRMRIGRGACRWAGLAVALAMAAAPLGAQDEADVEGLVMAGMAWVDENVPPELLAQVPLPSDADWQTFWTQIRQVLEGASLEQAAEWMPYVETGIRLLSRVQGGEEYAAWLRQRLDYFELAAALVRQFPAGGTAPPAVPARPSVPPRGTVRIIPSDPVAPVTVIPPPPAVKRQRETSARSVNVWRRVLGRRPAPEAAAGLVPRLKQAFKEEGVPPQLVWLAEVESSMNPSARNPGGAVGLFQFMPTTAQRFGLRIRPFDERKHPDKSARAAARYLRFLHGQFGSWPLAIAGYNAGEGRVKGLLAKSGGKSFEDIAARLPLETQMYVPKVQAVVHLREGVDAARLPPPAAGQASAPPPPLCLALLR